MSDVAGLITGAELCATLGGMDGFIVNTMWIIGYNWSYAVREVDASELATLSTVVGAVGSDNPSGAFMITKIKAVSEVHHQILILSISRSVHHKTIFTICS